MDAIAFDAELQEKSEAELKRIAETLQNGVQQAVRDFEEKQQEGQTAEGMLVGQLIISRLSDHFGLRPCIWLFG